MQTISDSPDRQLITALHADDARAFRALYDAYYEPLYRFLWRKTRDRETALDLMQDLFTRIWHKRRTLAADKPLRPLLYRIANNLAIDHLRRKTVRQSTVPETEAEAVADSAALPEDREWQGEFEHALQQLPEGQRQVFTLSRFEGLKYAEIAVLLKISVKAVEKRMSLALKTLRQNLAHLLTFMLSLKIVKTWVEFFSACS